jgi:hypothetical protein
MNIKWKEVFKLAQRAVGIGPDDPDDATGDQGIQLAGDRDAALGRELPERRLEQ